LPLFMCVFLSIAFFMKVVYIHNNVQYAINGAANEVATYSYLYSISGLQKVNDAITETTDEYGTTASEAYKIPPCSGLLEFASFIENLGGKVCAVSA